MSHIRIDNPVEREFAMVPNAIWSLPCSLKAKAVFAYLLSHRDGSYPSVALVEKTLGIHRDTRQKAMKELEQLGLVKWVIIRSQGKIVAKELCVTTAPLVVISPQPEKPVSGHHKPEKPANGKNRSSGPEKPVHTTGKSGDKIKQNYIKGSDISALTKFQRSELLQGRPILLDGRLISKCEAAQFAAMLQKIAGEKEGGV